VNYRVLGPLEAGDEQQPLPLGRRKQRALLARLLLDAGRTVGVERLVDDLWGEDVPETAVKMVQIYVSGLRKVLPADALRTRGNGYSLELATGDELDLHRFERLHQEARATADPGRARALLTQALGLWRGPALAEFVSEPFGRREGDRLEELRLAALEDRIEADLQLGRAAAVVGELEALTARHPLRERLISQLMLALYRGGRQSEALATYHRFRDYIDQELGTEPSPRLRALEQAILTHDPELDQPAANAPAIAPPGRHDELETLRRAYAQASAGARRLVLICGEPGIGKTTLVEALLGEVTDALIIRGQCVEHRGAAEAYLPLLDGLARAAQTHPEIRTVLAERAPSWLAQLPWLQAAPPAERAHGATSQRMLRELIEGLEGLAATTPVVLVLEDLQWADPSTVDLLGALLRRRHPGRLLVLATREGSDPQLAELRLRGSALEIPLEPLTAEAARAAFDLDAATAERLVERSGGNPLFMRHMVDHLDSDDVPTTLRAAIEGRLDALDPLTREALATAAVAGQTFAQAAVEAALRRPVPDLSALAEPRGTVEWPDGTVTEQFAFKHALYREVVYPHARAPELHRRIGERLEEAFGPDPSVAHEIAAHYVAGRLPAPAVRFLRLAAERCRARRAYREAIDLLERALLATDDLPEGPFRRRARVELLSELGQAHVALEGWSSPKALKCLQRARVTAELLGDREPLASVLLALATLHEVRGEPAPALDAIGAGAEIRDLGIDGAELMACALFHQGAFTRALEHADRGASHTGTSHYDTFPATLGDNAGVACHDWAALSLWFLGRPRESLKRARHALELAQEPARAYSVATASAQLAVLHACRREPAETLRYAQATVDAARDRGYQYRVAMGRVLRGWAHAATGRGDGVEEIARGLNASRATGAYLEDPFYLGLLADGHLRAGDHAAGLQAVEEALAIAARERAHYYDAELYRLRGELLHAAGRPDARESFERALERAREQGARSLELRAALALARAFPGAGTRAQLAAVAEALEEDDTPDGRAAAQLLTDTERRELTVVAWELDGLGDDPATVLRNAHAQARSAATAEGGTVGTEDEAGGLLYFDAPRRAIRAAHALAKALEPQRVSAGVETGDAVIAPIGGAPLALGEIPRTAWRLAAQAPPGGVLVGDATRQACAQDFAFIAHGAGHLARPLKDTELTPLVGRALELELLTARWEQAARGTGQAVVLTGEPGIGKTRLVSELARRVDHVIELQCADGYTASALRPFAEHLRHAELAALDLPDAPLLQALAKASAPDREPDTLRRATADAVCAYVLALAERRPLLVIVEDLHWADPSTVELLGELLDATAEARVLVVVTMRADAPMPWPERSEVSRLALAPCTPAEAESLVAHVADLPAAKAAAVLERGEGIPLYLEELAKAAAKDEEPTSLVDSVRARLDALSPAARETARAAALIGREFGADLLAAVVEPALGELTASGLVRRRAGRYAFRHALIQEVAAERRPDLHARIAHAIEHGFPALARAEPETVARHLERAGERARALPYRFEASKQALARSAAAEAADQLERALADLEADRTLEPDLWIAYGTALLHSRGYASPEARAAYARAETLCDDERLLAVRYGQWVNGFVTSRHDEALALALALRALAERHDPGVLVVANRAVGWSLFCLGRFEEARATLDDAVAPERRLQLRQLYAHDPVVAGLATSAWAAWGCGDDATADARARAAIAQGRALEHPLSLIYALGTGALLAGFQGDARTARERGIEAVGLTEAYAQPMWRAWTRYALAKAELLDGNAERACATVRSALEDSRRLGVTLFEPYALIVLAEAEAAAGRPDAAAECVAAAGVAARRGGELFWQPRAVNR